MARKTGKRTYKSRATKIKKEIAKWVEMGNPNAKDYDMLLRAEEAVLNKKYDKADGFYKQAIVRVCRIGHLSHAALYNERFAEYRLDVHGDGSIRWEKQFDTTSNGVLLERLTS